MRRTVVNQLASVLVEKGMITPHESTHLSQPQASSLSPHSLSRAGTWDDIDRNPVRSTGGE